jgi:hypothetical protein
MRSGFARRIMYVAKKLLFFFFPLLSLSLYSKYCKYTITTIINSSDFTSFSPFPGAQIPKGTKS